jgi:hypothetical protein
LAHDDPKQLGLEEDPVGALDVAHLLDVEPPGRQTYGFALTQTEPLPSQHVAIERQNGLPPTARQGTYSVAQEAGRGHGLRSSLPVRRRIPAPKFTN